MIDPKKFEAEDVIFSNPQKLVVDGEEYKKIFLTMKGIPNNKCLIFRTEKTLSSGARWNAVQRTLSIPLPLTENLTTFIVSIIEKCKSHLREKYSDEINLVNKNGKIARDKRLELLIESHDNAFRLGNEELINLSSSSIESKKENITISAEENICKCFNPEIKRHTCKGSLY